MSCRSTRNAILEGAVSRAQEVHMEGCPECRGFAQRRAMVALALGADRSAQEPDGAFAARVLARKPSDLEVLGSAAWRLIPGASLVALLALWLGVTAPPTPLDLLRGDADAALVLFVAAGP